MNEHRLPEPLRHHPALWQASRLGSGERAVLATGHPALDAALADGGWPRGALSELLLPAAGVGELPLLLPALAANSAAGDWLVLLSPPFLPAANVWQAAGIDTRRLLLLTPPDARSWLWSAEQAARISHCALLAWQGRYTPDMRALRRLQLAAQTGNSLFALLRPASARIHNSPAALRLALTPRERGAVDIDILKQRGGFAGRQVTLGLHAARCLPRIRPWELPVHLAPAATSAAFADAYPEAPATWQTNTAHPQVASRALAGHPLPEPAARRLDAQSAPPHGGAH